MNRTFLDQLPSMTYTVRQENTIYDKRIVTHAITVLIVISVIKFGFN